MTASDTAAAASTPAADPVGGSDDWGLLELTRAECLALLASMPIGRLVYTANALPAVIPVNFVLSGESIFLRTGEGTGLRATRKGVAVAFEVDDFDADGRAGWSVVVIGEAVEVTDPAVLRRAAELPLTPWASGRREHIVQIPVELVTGRRVGRAFTDRG